MVYFGKTADTIEMLYRMVGCVGPGNDVLKASRSPPHKMGQFGVGGMGWYNVLIGDAASFHIIWDSLLQKILRYVWMMCIE